MKLDTNNHLHATDGKYAHKHNAEAAVSLEAPASTLDQAFLEKLERTRAFMEAFGKKPGWRRETPEESALYSWVNRIREMDKADTLTEEQHKALDTLPISLLGGTIDEHRVKHLKELESYVEEHGRWPLNPEAQSDPTKARLARLFASTRAKVQKSTYADLRELIRTHLKPETAAVLLGEARHHSGHDLQWSTRFAELEEFTKEHGRLPSSHGQSKESSLYTWFSEWRASAREGSIPADRLQRLQGLELFKGMDDWINYDFRLDHWDEARERYKARLSEHFAKHQTPVHLLTRDSKYLGVDLTEFLQRIAARKREGKWVEPSLDELLTENLGAGWEGKKPKRSTILLTERIREFVVANGRRPMRKGDTVEERSLGEAVYSRGARVRRGKPLDDETWAAMNEIFGKDWDKRSRRSARQNNISTTPHPSPER